MIECLRRICSLSRTRRVLLCDQAYSSAHHPAGTTTDQALYVWTQISLSTVVLPTFLARNCEIVDGHLDVARRAMFEVYM